MTFPQLAEIKAARRRIGLTQSELAKKARVSQSLVAKIEAGRLQPSYEIAGRLFAVLEEVENEAQKTAQEIMNRHILCITPSDSLKAAIKKMKEHDISQLPVIEHGKVRGLVSEASILESLVSGQQAEKVSEVMSDAPPIIPKNSPMPLVLNVLKHCPLVIVAEEGKVLGLISRYDALTKAQGDL